MIYLYFSLYNRHLYLIGVLFLQKDQIKKSPWTDKGFNPSKELKIEIILFNMLQLVCPFLLTGRNLIIKYIL